MWSQRCVLFTVFFPELFGNADRYLVGVTTVKLFYSTVTILLVWKTILLKCEKYSVLESEYCVLCKSILHRPVLFYISGCSTQSHC